MSLLFQKAPQFSLTDQNGKTVSLSDFKGKNILLYFYPKDMTAGCTREACGFRDNNIDFNKKNIQIIGISKDSVDSHKEFAKKYHLEFPLLSDPEKEVIQKYGVWKEKSLYGKKYMGVSRESFLINPQGLIIRHFEKVNPIKHPQEVLKTVLE